MKTFITLVGIAILIAFASCTKIKTYPETPAIKVLGVSVPDSGMIKATVEFTDGDGDIGLAEGDTLPPYEPGSKYNNNVIVGYFERQNGVWVKAQEFKYRIQPITPAGKNKVLEGEMEINLFYNELSPYDTIKYSFQLFDRALHESNIAETEGMIVPN